MVKIIQVYLFFTYLHHRRGDGRCGGGILTTFTGVFIHARFHMDCYLGDFAEPGVTGDPLLNVACSLEGLLVSAGALEIGGVGAGNVSDVVSGHFVKLSVRLLVLFVIFYKIIQFYKNGSIFKGLFYLFYTLCKKAKKEFNFKRIDVIN